MPSCVGTASGYSCEPQQTPSWHPWRRACRASAAMRNALQAYMRPIPTGERVTRNHWRVSCNLHGRTICRACRFVSLICALYLWPRACAQAHTSFVQVCVMAALRHVVRRLLAPPGAPPPRSIVDTIWGCMERVGIRYVHVLDRLFTLLVFGSLLVIVVHESVKRCVQCDLLCSGAQRCPFICA